MIEIGDNLTIVLFVLLDFTFVGFVLWRMTK